MKIKNEGKGVHIFNMNFPEGETVDIDEDSLPAAKVAHIRRLFTEIIPPKPRELFVNRKEPSSEKDRSSFRKAMATRKKTAAKKAEKKSDDKG